MQAPFKILKGPRGFTLIELLIFAAIFSILMISFISILVTITTLHSRQVGVAEVNQQSQFLLQQMQYYIERSSLIEMGTDIVTSTLKLRMASSTEDPTYIYLSGTKVFLKHTDTGEPQPLTSDQIVVSELNFRKRWNDPTRSSVDISMSVSYNTQNIKQGFSETLRTAIARVSAATFDSNLVPGNYGGFKLGVSAAAWTSINDVIYFENSNVGIGFATPNSKLHVSGGDIYIDTIGRGLILRDSGGGCWRLGVSTNGTTTASSIACP